MLDDFKFSARAHDIGDAVSFGYDGIIRVGGLGLGAPDKSTALGRDIEPRRERITEHPGEGKAGQIEISQGYAFCRQRQLAGIDIGQFSAEIFVEAIAAQKFPGQPGSTLISRTV